MILGIMHCFDNVDDTAMMTTFHKNNDDSSFHLLGQVISVAQMVSYIQSK